MVDNNEKTNLDRLARVGKSKKNEERVKKHFLNYFKKNDSKISFGKKIEALYEWLTSGRLSGRDKAIVIGVLIYFINPMDILPDFTPFLGFTDDLSFVYLVYNYLQNRSIEEIAPDIDDEGENTKE